MPISCTHSRQMMYRCCGPSNQACPVQVQRKARSFARGKLACPDWGKFTFDMRQEKALWLTKPFQKKLRLHKMPQSIGRHSENNVLPPEKQRSSK